MTEALAMQKRLNRSQDHQNDLKGRLGHFAEKFGASPVRTVQTKEIEEWLHALRLAPQSFNNYRARVSSLFGYGVKRGYLERNPVSAID